MNKKRIFVVLMTILLLFTACSGGKDGVVATVDGVEIPQEKFDAHYKIQRTSIVQYMGEEALEEKHPEDDFNRTFGEIFRTQVLDNLIADQVIINAANEAGIEAADQAKEIVSEEMEYAGEDYFDEILSEMGLDLEQYTSMVEDAILIQEYRSKRMSEIEVTNEEIAEYYEEHQEELEQVRVSHILVDTKDEADNVLKRLDNGEDFAELAMELSQDPGSAAQGGDLDYISRETNFVPEFLEAAFLLGKDEVSEPVETEHGFHIIKVTDKIEDLESSSEQISQILKNIKFLEEAEEMQKKAKIKKHIDLSKEPESIKNDTENNNLEDSSDIDDLEDLDSEESKEVEDIEEPEDTQKP